MNRRVLYVKQVDDSIITTCGCPENLQSCSHYFESEIRTSFAPLLSKFTFSHTNEANQIVINEPGRAYNFLVARLAILNANVRDD